MFRPAGRETQSLEEVLLQLDELEAIRLADAEGLYHEEGARQMGVSRPTFGRILGAARRKVALALTRGMAIRIEGGHVAEDEGPAPRRLRCPGCEHRWTMLGEAGRPGACPACGGASGQEPVALAVALPRRVPPVQGGASEPKPAAAADEARPDRKKE